MTTTETDNESSPSDREPTSVIDVLRRLKSGDLPAESLDVEARQACVDHLALEGLSCPEIAQILKVTDRTVRRDRQAIRAGRALRINPQQTQEIIGMVVHRAELAIERLSRAARDKSARPFDRIAAEFNCWRVAKELLETLHRAGCLSPVAVQVRDTARTVEPPIKSRTPETPAELDNLVARLTPQDRHIIRTIFNDITQSIVVSYPPAETASLLTSPGFSANDGQEPTDPLRR